MLHVVRKALGKGCPWEANQIGPERRLRAHQYLCKSLAIGNRNSTRGEYTLRIRIIREGQSETTVEYDGKGPLSKAIWLSGKLEPIPLCAGIGRCGKCRVRFVSTPPVALEEEVERLGKEAVDAGWRLACRCQIPDSEEELLEVPGLARAPLKEKAPGKHRGEPQGSCVWGFDLGTTSIAWRALDAKNGEILSEGQALNPQAGAGADVVSRIAMAQDPQGKALLSQLVRTFLRARMDEVGLSPSRVVVAANTAMSAILLQADVSGLAHAPYSTSIHGHESCRIVDLGEVYIPPLPAPFVGGDITAGLAFLGHAGARPPYLLADLGTNGEIALVCERDLYLTSVPLGPALEGIGLECGALAGDDVVTNVTAGPAGLVAKTADGRLVTGDAPCRGISATGYLSLMDLLRRMGIMDEAGHILRDPYGCAMPLARRIAGLWDWNGSVPRLVLLPNLWMSSADVEEILKVKAAFAVAVESLLAKACLRPGSLNAICVAGALGRHVDAGILENLGFVPRGCGRMVRAVGNASLEGACLLAREPKYREELAALCARACVLAPAEEKDFHTRYVGAMNFAPWGEYAGKI